MKTLIAVLVLLASVTLAPAPTTNSPSVTLAWDRTTNPAVNAYGVYWGTVNGVYTNSVTVQPASLTTVTISNLVRGVTYYFAATSRTTNGLESAYSGSVSTNTVPLPDAPFNLTITVTIP